MDQEDSGNEKDKDSDRSFSSRSSSKSSASASSAEEDASEQLLHRFQNHLLKHFGTATLTVEAFASPSGVLALPTLIRILADKDVSPSDSKGVFDLRRIFHILDAKTGQVTASKLLGDDITKEAGARSMGNMRRGTTLPRSEMSGGGMLVNPVERFRRLLIQRFSTLAAANKALDGAGAGLGLAALKKALESKGVELSDAEGSIDIEAVFASLDFEGKEVVTAEDVEGNWEKANKTQAAAAPPKDTRLIEVKKQVKQIERFRAHLAKAFKGDARATFEDMDADQDDKVTFDDLLTFFDRNKIGIRDDTGCFDLHRMFWILDVNGDQSLSFEDFFKVSGQPLCDRILHRAHNTDSVLPSTVRTMYSLERLRRHLEKEFGSRVKAFEALDANGNGDLSLGEIKSEIGLRKLSTKDEIGFIDLANAFRACDMDGEGEVKLDDFIGIARIKPPPSEAKAKFVSAAQKVLAKKKALKRATEEEHEDDFQRIRMKSIFCSKERRSAVGGLLRLDSQKEDDSRPAGRSVPMQAIEDFSTKPHADLSLRFSAVGDWGAERLAKNMLPVGSAMRFTQVIDLHGAYIGDKGVVEIATSIEKNCALSKLYLEWNGICDAGAARLAETISKVVLLKELNLANNRICNAGAVSLAKSIGQKPKPGLEVLDLRHNLIGVAGAKALKESQPSPFKLEVNLVYGEDGGDIKPPKRERDYFWEGDYAYAIPKTQKLGSMKAQVRPSSTPNLPSATAGFAGVSRTLSIAMAANLTLAEVGDAWPPTQNLMRSMSLAKTWGEGGFREKAKVAKAVTEDRSSSKGSQDARGVRRKDAALEAKRRSSVQYFDGSM